MPETGSPEFRNDSLQSLGQYLKAAEAISPDVFPYRVVVPKKSSFFKGAYERVFEGKGSKDHLPNVLVERNALMAVNDLGELMIGKTIAQGNGLLTVIDIETANKIMNARHPAGWRTLGVIHSHPATDAANSILLSAVGKIPEFGPIPATWSSVDFLAFLSLFKYGRFSTFGLITPVQLSLLVASKQTTELMRDPKKAVDIILESTANISTPLQKIKESLYQVLVKPSPTNVEKIKAIVAANLLLPPYHVFDKLGIILYSGRHAFMGKEFTLEKWK